MDPSTHVGALIMPPHDRTGHMDRVMGYIDRAKADPCNTLLLGGNAVEVEIGGGLGGEGKGGCYVEPTIFECTSDDSEVRRGNDVYC